MDDCMREALDTAGEVLAPLRRDAAGGGPGKGGAPFPPAARAGGGAGAGLGEAHFPAGLLACRVSRATRPYFFDVRFGLAPVIFQSPPLLAKESVTVPPVDWSTCALAFEPLTFTSLTVNFVFLSGLTTLLAQPPEALVTDCLRFGEKT